MRRAAENTATVLVEGESGTGKELVCRAIHDLGPRRLRSVHRRQRRSPRTHADRKRALRSRTRGVHRRGGAARRLLRTRRERNALSRRDRGAPLEAQAKLLRVLEQREFQRVGGHKTLSVNARVIVATNQNLRELVRAGRFRADLFYRLHVLSIRVPPLRERREDVLPLADHFLARCEATWVRARES